MREMKNVNMQIVQQGAVRVHCACIEREAPGIVCMYIDLDSKRAELLMTSSGPGEAIEIYFIANEDTLYLDESKLRDTPTIIAFPDYKGWKIFCVEGPGRYTASLVLISNEN